MEDSIPRLIEHPMSPWIERPMPLPIELVLNVITWFHLAIRYSTHLMTRRRPSSALPWSAMRRDGWQVAISHSTVYTSILLNVFTLLLSIHQNRAIPLQSLLAHCHHSGTTSTTRRYALTQPISFSVHVALSENMLSTFHCAHATRGRPRCCTFRVEGRF